MKVLYKCMVEYFCLTTRTSIKKEDNYVVICLYAQFLLNFQNKSIISALLSLKGVVLHLIKATSLNTIIMLKTLELIFTPLHQSNKNMLLASNLLKFQGYC